MHIGTPINEASSEDAVEHDELAIFLRLNESYDASVEEDRPLLEEKVIGVPGATPNPSPMKPKVAASASSTPSKSPGPAVTIPATPQTPALPKVPPPTPVNKRDDFDVSEELSGYGLQGVKVTHDELAVSSMVLHVVQLADDL
jgi:hypothetical protein